MADQPTDQTGIKSKWKSKAFIAAAVTVIVGAVQPISTALGHPIEVPNWILEVLAGLGLYGIRDAIGKDSALKALIVCALFGLMSRASAYDVTDFVKEVKRDTAAQALKNIKTSYLYDFLEDDNSARSKVAIGTTILAWKFISFDPLFIYVPTAADKKAEVGFSFPIYPGEIPIGEGRLLKDALFPPEVNNNELWKRFYFGLYLSQNVTTGRFGFGLNTGIKF